MVVIRRLEETDSISDLTALIRRAYSKLADLDLRFVATWQGEDITKDRVSHGECYVARLDNVLAGTVTLRGPNTTAGCPWYDKPGVASFGQFAVEPDLQGQGIGDALLAHIEARARELGAEELALDTAKPAKHLIDFYAKRGYRLVGEVDWRPHTNYLSVVMSKRL